MPSVNPGEKESHYVSRCMGDPSMRERYPKQDNRAAVCYSLYRHHGDKKSRAGLELTWDDTAAEIERTGVIATDEGIHIARLPDLAPVGTPPA